MLSRKVIFGLGSNLGDKKSYLEKAVAQLEKRLLLKNLKQSHILKNPALLLPNSPCQWDQEFFNIALSAEIDLHKFGPENILKIVKRIEKDLGRKDTARWSPREIDIDILLIEGLEVKIPNLLTIPHVALFDRDFFLKTVQEIEPQWQNFLVKNDD